MRAIVPRFLNNQEVIVFQFKCDPRTVEDGQFNLHFCLIDVMQRYDLQLGQSFDVQFVNDDRTQLIALQRYIVVTQREEIVRTDVSHYQTMQRNVFRRSCEPTSDLIFFTEIEEEDAVQTVNGESDTKKKKKKKTRPKLSDVISPNDARTPNYAGMGLPQLQKMCKEKLGHGFPMGTTANAMIQALEEHDKAYSEVARG